MGCEDTDELEQKIPSVDENPKERKRILGILAQRRYRQRKKQRRTATLGSEINCGAQTIHADADDIDVLSPWTTNAFAGVTVGAQRSLTTQPEHSEPSWSDSLALWNLSDVENPIDISTGSWDILAPADIATGTTGITSPAGAPHSEYPPQPGPIGLFPFADAASISIPCLDLVRAHVQILSTVLTTLKMPYPKTDTIWNPFAISPFHASPDASHLADQHMLALPANYRPTSTQMKVAHHPVFDLLPWPNVRDKLLGVMTLPIGLRPARAQDDTPNVVMQIKFDMFDPSGGVKIHGTDPMNADNWEVGQVFFENWWWALNAGVIKRSNEYRRARGDPDLKLKRKCAE